MIPKTKHFDWIEDYCLGQLNESQKQEFEAELGRNSELKEELQFEMELQSALKEKDVLNLREKLDAIANQPEEKDDGFNLLQGLTDVQELTETVAPEDLLDFYDSLPKVHVYQHELASNENIHQFYKEQNHYLSEMNDLENSFEDMDMEDIEGLNEAILEKDVLNLRNTLSQVSSSIQLQFSAEEIDNYIAGKLEDNELQVFEDELNKNNALQKEVELHAELENAVNEYDVRGLRDKLAHVMETESSWNVSEENIEEFIDGELNEELLAEFEEELEYNTDLKAEISLRENVNAAIAEKDIFSLRNKLRQVEDETNSKEIKSIIPDTGMNLNWWRAGVAVAIIIFAIAGVVNREFGSLNKSVDNYYTSADWSPERSVTSETGFLQKADMYRMSGNYKEALKTYDQAIKEVNENYPYRFWKATLLQDLEKYEKAIPEYAKVIEHGNNTFIEEAEWYKSYCYIKLEDWENAKEQLLAIIERKGFYENDAKAILRRIKYSFK